LSIPDVLKFIEPREASYFVLLDRDGAEWRFERREPADSAAPVTIEIVSIGGGTWRLTFLRGRDGKRQPLAPSIVVNYVVKHGQNESCWRYERVACATAPH